MSIQQLVTASLAGVPQARIAAALRVDQSAVSKRMAGRLAWSLSDVERLAAVLPEGDRLVLVPERETVAYAERHTARAAR